MMLKPSIAGELIESYVHVRSQACRNRDDIMASWFLLADRMDPRGFQGMYQESENAEEDPRCNFH